MPNTYVFCIIIYKFGYWQKFSWIVLFEIDNSLKVGFYIAVLLLYLAIILKIKSGEKMALNTEEIIK